MIGRPLGGSSSLTHLFYFPLVEDFVLPPTRLVSQLSEGP